MTPRRREVSAGADAPDRHDLYELAAQSPRRQAAFLRALVDPSIASPTLGEDFCGTGALSRAWVGLPGSGGAVCVDRDPEPLSRLQGAAGITVRHGDVREASDPVDLLCALNFSICELHEREDMLAYLRHARGRLREGGVFVCDLYDGADAFALGESEVELREGECGAGVRYVWEQREANPLTGRVVNAMHFQLADGSQLRDAFVYDWRLWRPPEMRDAMREAGFARVEAHDRLGDGVDEEGRVYATPLDDADDLEENFVVYLAARG